MCLITRALEGPVFVLVEQRTLSLRPFSSERLTLGFGFLSFGVSVEHFRVGSVFQELLGSAGRLSEDNTVILCYGHVLIRQYA